MIKNETSIKRRLLLGVLGALLITWLVVITLVYRSSAHEIAEIYDASLVSYARVLATLMSHEAAEELDIQNKLQLLAQEIGMQTVKSSRILSEVMSRYANPSTAEDYLTLEPAKTSHDGHQYESKIAFLVKESNGKVLLRSSAEVPFDQVFIGFDTIKSGKASWRVFGLTEQRIGITVMVGEKIEVRTELQQEILTNVLWPFFIILPLIALLVFIIINKGLKPLQTVADKVATRSHLSLEPLSLNATPVEVLPLVNEINRLFQRIEQALENERRFTANAAHELRTPLAAIKTQVQVLQLNATQEMEPAIRHILSSVDRTTRLVEQLLTLARTEARSHKGLEFKPVRLASLVRIMMQDMSSLASKKHISLSFEDSSPDAQIAGDEALLQIVIQNILDNAIRYTPLNGSVKVAIEKIGGRLQLSFEDSGPGIPAKQQESMFRRFQRGNEHSENGVGLGLFIVRQIAGLHNIDIRLESPSAKHGFIIRLVFSN